MSNNNESQDAICEESFFGSLKAYLHEVLHSDYKTFVILIYAALALTLWKYIPLTPHFADAETGQCVFSFGTKQLTRPLSGNIDYAIIDYLWNARKLWGAFLLMGLGPTLIVKYVFKESLADYGLSSRSWKQSLRLSLCFIPIFLIIGWCSGYTRAYYAVYPFNPFAGISWETLSAHSILYFFLYYLPWEFMFRGFMLIGLSRTLGIGPAVLIQVLASSMLHYGHPLEETLGCIGGGILWAFFALRTKSIWAGWWQHALLGVALDWSLIINAC